MLTGSGLWCLAELSELDLGWDLIHSANIYITVSGGVPVYTEVPGQVNTVLRCACFLAYALSRLANGTNIY